MPTSTLFVGINVSLKSNQVCPINFNQDMFFNNSFENSPEGCESLIKEILNVLDKHRELTQITVCIKSTNIYHIHISMF